MDLVSLRRTSIFRLRTCRIFALYQGSSSLRGYERPRSRSDFIVQRLALPEYLRLRRSPECSVSPRLQSADN